MFTKLFSLKKWTFVFLALSLVLSAFGAASSAQAASCSQYYTVKQGEYLSQIAQKYGVDWRILADVNGLKDASVIYPGQKLCISSDAIVLPDTGNQQDSDVPTIDFLAAVKGEEVTIQAYNLPVYTRFDVLMGKIGTMAVNGTKVGAANSGAQGVFEATFDIPASLAAEKLIAIRIQSKNGWYSYNWFSNSTFTTARGGPSLPVSDKNSKDTSWQWVDLGDKVDAYKGNSGIYMPSAGVSGWLKIERFDASNDEMPIGLRFAQDLVEVGLFDKKLDQIDVRMYGMNYLYFNLTSVSRKAYDAGNLGIFSYNQDTDKWEACQVEMLIKTKNGPNGRLACIVNDFGLYALAYK